MKIKATLSKETSAGKPTLVCPQCGNTGTFDELGKDLKINNEYSCGQRRCPNTACLGHVFVVFDKRDAVVTYPPVRLTFDSENVPASVQVSLEEAIACHSAKAFIAAAIMLRRTLEKICDNRGATGNNLKARIKDLESKIVLPRELIDSMDELRLLGNDAAHIEARTFAEISEQELAVAFEFTKEIIKGLYQYSSLLERLRSLKVSDPKG